MESDTQSEIEPSLSEEVIAEYEKRLDDALQGRVRLLERDELFELVRKSLQSPAE